MGRKLSMLKVVIFLALLAISGGLAVNSAQAAIADNKPCLSCHGQAEFRTKYLGESLANPSVFIDPSVNKESSHGTYSCRVCHREADVKSMPVTGISALKVRRDANASCSGCHAAEANLFQDSAHGASALQARQEVFCSDCHGSHGIAKKEISSSMVSRDQITKTCTRCHTGKERESYLRSFHGRALGLGSKQTATCVSCHGSHDTLGPKKPDSSVSPRNVPTTCGKCHGVVAASFAMGAEHYDIKPYGPGAPVYWVKKVFSWLIIVVLGLMLVHMQLELLSYLWQNVPAMFNTGKK